MQVDLVDRKLLALQGVLGVFAPVVGGSDDNAVRERCFAGSGEETINVLLLDAVVLGIQLALDGVVLACPLGARHQVDAGVATVQSLFFGPVAICPYFIVEVAIGRFVAEIGEDQLFEVSTFFAFGDRCRSVGVEQGLKGGH